MFRQIVTLTSARYLLMQLPSNMLMASNRVRPSVYMGICMALWGVVSGLTAATHNYIGLLLVRFFLGVAEAPCTTPDFLIIPLSETNAVLLQSILGQSFFSLSFTLVKRWPRV